MPTLLVRVGPSQTMHAAEPDRGKSTLGALEEPETATPYERTLLLEHDQLRGGV